MAELPPSPIPRFASSRNTIRLRFQVDGMSELLRAARAIGEPEMPYLRDALMESASTVATAARGFAKGGLASRLGSPRLNRGRNPSAKFDVRHPGSRSMEFGRLWYYRGYTVIDGRIRGGRRFRSIPGQRPRPYLGIINGDAAIGATSERVKRIITEAVSAEWDRLGRS